MTEQMKKERIRQALDTEFAFLNTTPSQRRQLLSAYPSRWSWCWR